jgi:hypothetical protein
MHDSISKGTTTLQILSIAVVTVFVIIVRFRQALHTPPVPPAAAGGCPAAAMPHHLAPPLLLLGLLLLLLLLMQRRWGRLLWLLLLLGRCLLLAALGCRLCHYSCLRRALGTCCCVGPIGGSSSTRGQCGRLGVVSRCSRPCPST